MLTKIIETKPAGSKYATPMVAPLSVRLEHRRSGVGLALMNEGIRIARTMGYKAAFWLGNSNDYQQFGYQSTESHGISHNSYPMESLQAKEIATEALKGITGLINM